MFYLIFLAIGIYIVSFLSSLFTIDTWVIVFVLDIGAFFSFRSHYQFKPVLSIILVTPIQTWLIDTMVLDPKYGRLQEMAL